MRLFTFLFLLLTLMLGLYGCKPEEEIFPSQKEEELELEGDQKLFSGTVSFPANIDPETITIVSTSGSYRVKADGYFKGLGMRSINNFSSLRTLMETYTLLHWQVPKKKL